MLANSKNKKRRDSLVNIASADEIRAITEIVRNCLAGNFPLKKECLCKMKRHKKKAETVESKEISISRKEKANKANWWFVGFIDTGGSVDSSIFGKQPQEEEEKMHYHSLECL